MIASLSILQITLLFIAYTLTIVFPEISESPFTSGMQNFSIFFYLFEMVYNCVTVKSTGGKKVTSYKEIFRYYSQNNLAIDLISYVILIVDFSTSLEEFLFVRLFIVTKLPQCLEKMEKLEVYFIKSYYNEQYWSLIKVFLFNFCFAHILAILLNGMTRFNPKNNWYFYKDIYHAHWSEKYIWAYYWGANIMLTVGFGDITAVTKEEAICLIFIEFFSVICLAYNINWVGTLICNIRSQDLEKGHNFKTFKQLTDKYSLSENLEWKISNFIQESVNIRKKFNVEKERSFIENLPDTLRKEYLKESNRNIFQDLPFFGNLIDKTLYLFAEKIEMNISHPEQMLRSLDDDYNLLILREGVIGYTTKRRNCFFNDMVIDEVAVLERQRPFILGLEFLTLRRPNYEIKSLEYSMIYFLSYDGLISTIKESPMDYLHFCFIRDKNKCVLDEFEVLLCEFCKNKKHTKFTCPRLHYTPIHQLVIFKEQRKEKINKNYRV